MSAFSIELLSSLTVTGYADDLGFQDPLTDSGYANILGRRGPLFFQIHLPSSRDQQSNIAVLFLLE